MELLHYYDDAVFLNPDGTMNLTTNVRIISDMCLKYGLKQNGEYQIVQGFTLYPKDFFCPFNYINGRMDKTKNTSTIHWFSGSWYSEQMKKGKKLQRLKTRIAEDIYHAAVRILGQKRYEAVRDCLRRKK